MNKFLYSLVFLFLGLSYGYAEGSKDLYPSDAVGNRAFLVSGTGVNTASYPYGNLGIHYAYVKSGETIHAASSAQGVRNGRIRLTAPDGTVYTSGANTTGQIPNRIAEVAGPSSTGATVGDAYSTFNRLATNDQVGIWKIEFIAPGGITASDTPQVDMAATGSWSQANNNAGTTASIAAWDVSVRNSANNAWVNGRVYTNQFNFIINASFTEAKSFYGKNYVLTKDGYIYHVNNNGSNGVGFISYVNSKGFVDSANKQTYKSLTTSTITATQGQDPRDPDGPKGLTHKLFYNLPSTDLPISSNSKAVPGGVSTWLKSPRSTATASNITFSGVDGTAGQMGEKGGNIAFDSDSHGTYVVLIESDDPGVVFPSRTLTGDSEMGINTVFWNGKDGAGNNLPITGNIPVKVSVTLKGGEVHFPYIDMEINPKGIIIELLRADLSVESDVVYWDDSLILTGLAGEKSSPLTNLTGLSSGTTIGTTLANGHKWGTYSASSGSGNGGKGSYSFGNEKSMDTWSFVQGSTVTKTTSVNIKVADLKVSSITTDKSNLSAGDTFNIEVKVKNDGPDGVTGAPFSFILPAGFEANGTPVFTGNTCGSENLGITYNATTRIYSSKLALPNGCEITYSFPVKVNTVVTPANGNNNFTATILRPNDVTDPDATNPDVNTPPTDPFYECANNGLSTACNNIKSVVVTYFSNPFACNENMYLSQNNPTQLNLVNTTNLANLQFSPVGANSAINFNAIGYNAIDNHIYGIKNNTGELIKFGADGSFINLGTVLGLPINVEYNAGEFDLAGNLYIKINVVGNILYKINVSTKTATPITLDNNITVLDFAFNKNDNHLYAVLDNIGAAQNGMLIKVSLTGTVTTIGAADPVLRSFGGMIGANGEIYGFLNSGGFYKFDIVTGTRTKVSDSPSSSINDAAHCPSSPITEFLCYNPAVTAGSAQDTKVGITLLKRASAQDADNWPMVRKGGFMALESNNQGFVPTRIAKANLGNITKPQEGMMVYDTTDKCLKIYTGTEWKCFSTPACP
ncbi:DUF11 domain-containing protein [Chryseobacterium turcicum]|uniref:DUF11 domain-containing protein n=1 Tax=Chryseobacterium turcicum TaxID=2898076 RepID=A0A9Q3YVX0_9FLAO|nr:DUF11 domain-containing protein [Chryseobacterium turcicum]MCD1117374.1 DUF11 domain-containing protein [Chryseobacterium turcicum]